MARSTKTNDKDAGFSIKDVENDRIRRSRLLASLEMVAVLAVFSIMSANRSD